MDESLKKLLKKLDELLEILTPCNGDNEAPEHGPKPDFSNFIV